MTHRPGQVSRSPGARGSRSNPRWRDHDVEPLVELVNDVVRRARLPVATVVQARRSGRRVHLDGREGRPHERIGSSARSAIRSGGPKGQSAVGGDGGGRRCRPRRSGNEPYTWHTTTRRPSGSTTGYAPVPDAEGPHRWAAGAGGIPRASRVRSSRRVPGKCSVAKSMYQRDRQRPRNRSRGQLSARGAAPRDPVGAGRGPVSGRCPVQRAATTPVSRREGGADEAGLCRAASITRRVAHAFAPVRPAA